MINIQYISKYTVLSDSSFSLPRWQVYEDHNKSIVTSKTNKRGCKTTFSSYNSLMYYATPTITKVLNATYSGFIQSDYEVDKNNNNVYSYKN